MLSVNICSIFFYFFCLDFIFCYLLQSLDVVKVERYFNSVDFAQILLTGFVMINRRVDCSVLSLHDFFSTFACFHNVAIALYFK